jgi:hypothetical protein
VRCVGPLGEICKDPTCPVHGAPAGMIAVPIGFIAEVAEARREGWYDDDSRWEKVDDYLKNLGVTW